MTDAACPRCGAAVASSFAFCSACGHPLQQQQRPADDERRLVSVLFADIVGFTARAEKLDPEDVRALLRPYHQRLKSEIEAIGGVVEKFIGDAVVGVFGAPVAHGDDAERAVRAALAVTRAITELNATNAGMDLQVRVGVNTGEVITAGGADVSRGEGLVTGDVVNTASRLQTAAPVNGVLVGDLTYRCTRTAIAYGDAASIALKGKEAAVTAWPALHELTDPGVRVAASAPLLGRDDELRVLTGAWQEVVDGGRSRVVSVIGEAGIGKSRLTAEFAGSVEARGATVLRGRSLPYGATTPYGPFSEHVKTVARVFASDDEAVATAKLDAAVAAVVDGDAAAVASGVAILAGVGGGEATDRRMLFAAARAFYAGLAQRGPVLLLFEDVHWADEGMLDLIEALEAGLSTAPILLLVVARPALLDRRPDWGAHGPEQQLLQLEPLGVAAARDMALALLGAGGDRDAAADAAVVIEAADGNPLFIEELATSLAEESSSRSGGVPATVRDVIAARLDALPPRARALLLDAAVVGRIFWRGALVRLATDDDVRTWLDPLVQRGLVAPEEPSWIEGDAQFHFKHVLIREVAYATIPFARRRQRHAAVAAFLEAGTGAGGSTLTALAEHWREAGEPARALPYLVLAAEQAGRGWAKAEAARLYRRALELVPDDDAEQRRDLARRRALAIQASFHVADARSLAGLDVGPDA